MTERRVDYDRIADKYDRRYARQKYDGIREAIDGFLGSQPLNAILDAGCGTGHWLAEMTGRAQLVVGMDRSGKMLARAREASPASRLVCAAAEYLPFAPAAFDRVLCVNALHHFTERERFFDAVRRLLKPGGGLMTIGLDPHANRDQWWVYDYFPEALEIDRARFWPIRIIRGELVKAGFAWAESAEVERVESARPFRDMFPQRQVDRAFTSQFIVLDDEAFAGGVERLRQADDASGGSLELTSDLRFYATTAWTPS